MKTINLTQGQFAKVDDEDFERFGHLKWYARWDSKGRCFYAVRNYQDTATGKRRTLLLHREILGITDPKVLVDHINRDTLDYCRKNLRPVNPGRSCMNRGVRRDSSSRIRGVTWNKRLKKWVAQIFALNKKIHLGCFSDINLAAEAYAVANRKYFGEYGGI